MTILTTHRLILRPPLETDADALVRGLSNPNVACWTGRIPHPYVRADAEAYIAHHLNCPAGETLLFITRQDELIGGIGIAQEDLGYWLAEPHWGQGYGTEAARAVTDHAFESEGRGRLEASYHFGNAASRRILLGLGFTETGESLGFSKARQADVTLVNLLLTREAWANAKERRR